MGPDSHPQFWYKLIMMQARLYAGIVSMCCYQRMTLSVQKALLMDTERSEEETARILSAAATYFETEDGNSPAIPRTFPQNNHYCGVNILGAKGRKEFDQMYNNSAHQCWGFRTANDTPSEERSASLDEVPSTFEDLLGLQPGTIAAMSPYCTQASEDEDAGNPANEAEPALGKDGQTDDPTEHPMDLTP
jgi:hypothetical protein